ncbi:MAG TPA: diguanylate cyclase, partial [Burkholderiaceae bacterium]|nr:diguanylate cyclase [Burkholderiaceae bacterium]
LFVCLAFFMVFFLLTRKTYSGFSSWATAFGCLAFGYVLLVLRGIAPDWASILVANYALMTGITLLFDGITRFSGREWRMRVNGIFHMVAAGCVALLAYYTYVDQNVNARVAVVNIFRFLSHGACFVALILFEPKHDRSTHRPLAALFLGSAMLGAFRAGFALHTSTIANLYDDPTFRLFMLIDLGLVTGIAFCLPVLTHMRVEQELERERAAAERASWTDKLTGLWNRAHFEAEVERRLREADRFGDALSLLMFDIDHFKLVNDRFGHLIGDEVLRDVASRASNCFRSTDLLCRWGGEEFVAVLRAPLEAATIAADKLRLSIASQSFAVAGQVTISIGVADRRIEEDFSAWMLRADQALYRAKANGRNRVEQEANHDAPPSPVYMRWNPAFLTGDPVLDEQHKALFEKATLLFEKCAISDRDSAITLLQQILDHADRHYRYEEHILQMNKYPLLGEHSEEHRRLRERGSQMLADISANKLGLDAILDFVVKDIVLGHIAEEDARYISFLNHRTEPVSVSAY